MNVALVIRRFTEQGGMERFCVGLARYLHSRGHAVHVYCAELRPDLEVLPLSWHLLPGPRRGGFLKMLHFWWKTGEIAGHDVVLGFARSRGHQVFRAGGGAHAAWQAAMKPWWFLDPTEWVERAVDRACVLGARRVISPSHRAGQDLREFYGLSNSRLRVIPNGVDAARFHPDAERRAALRAEWGVQGPLLAFLGSGFARKGLDLAAEVARRLALPLVVIGGDAHLEVWRKRFPDVRFLGPQEHPENLLPAADVLLLPTRYEPFGNACLEAMACGVVPVTTPDNGATEVMPEGLAGAGLEGLVAATRRALDGGEALKARCRALAATLSPETAFAAVEAVLAEAASDSA